MMLDVWDSFTETQWKQYLFDVLDKSNYAVTSAVLAIYNNQTEEEKTKRENVEDNGIGFTKYDVQFLSALANKIKAHVPLTDSEMSIAKHKMCKYWKQLMNISKNKLGQKTKEEKKKEFEISKQYFKMSLRALRDCAENGNACEYGICDECPIHSGLQMRL